MIMRSVSADCTRTCHTAALGLLLHLHVCHVWCAVPCRLVLQVLALFGNGRIEEWLNCSGITPADMCDPKFVPRIALLLRQFHGLDIALSRQPHAPWGVIGAWLQKAKSLQFEDPVKLVRVKLVVYPQLCWQLVSSMAAILSMHKPPLLHA